MPAVSSSMRIGEPVAVALDDLAVVRQLGGALGSLRSALIDLYMCDAARLTVTWSGWSPGRWWSWRSTRSVVARSSGSMPSGVGWSLLVTGGGYGAAGRRWKRGRAGAAQASRAGEPLMRTRSARMPCSTPHSTARERESTSILR